jgi:hypothetical protein
MPRLLLLKLAVKAPGVVAALLPFPPASYVSREALELIHTQSASYFLCNFSMIPYDLKVCASSHTLGVEASSHNDCCCQMQSFQLSLPLRDSK